MPCELKGFRGLDISKEVFWFSRKPFWVRFGPLLPKAKAGTLVDRRVLALYSKAKAGTFPLRGGRLSNRGVTRHQKQKMSFGW